MLGKTVLHPERNNVGQTKTDTPSETVDNMSLLKLV